MPTDLPTLTDNKSPTLTIRAEPCVNLGCVDGVYRGSPCQDCTGRGPRPGWVWPEWAITATCDASDTGPGNAVWQLNALYAAQEASNENPS